MKKHSRYLTATLATAAFLAHSPSYALGIGDIKLQSSLNQNLKAEIALILSDDENAADLKIDLASNAKFDESGIPWTVFLSKIKFQTVTENGRTFIKLSSKDVLKEPFLDFLIEIKNSKSTLYREFTVLVDPPAAYTSIDAPDVSKPTISNLPQRFVSAPTKSNEFLVAEKPVRAIAKPKPLPKPVVVVTKEKAIVPVSAVVKPAPKTELPAPKTHTKVFELEKQLSEMKKTIAEKDAQIALLKTPEPSISAPKIPVVVPPISVSSPAAMPELLPTIIPPVVAPPVVAPQVVAPIPAPIETAATTPLVSTLPITPVAPVPVAAVPVAIIPAPITIPSVKPVEPTPAPNFTTELLNSALSMYSNLGADSTYYVAGAASSLLLSLLGFLRLRNRHKVVKEDNNVAPEIVADEIPKEEIKLTVENERVQLEDSMSKMFSDNDSTSNVSSEAFEEQSLSEFDTLMDKNSSSHNIDNVIYKADVYCAYGNHEQAISLLRDEFAKNPNADDYALRLLKLYVSQNDKEAFKEFVFDLAKQGKKDVSEFWAQVSDVAADFYPEALFFMPPPAIPNPLTAISSNDMLASVDSGEKFDYELDFDTMRFDDAEDKEIVFGEISHEESLNRATADFFASSVQFEDTKDDIESNGFTFNESLLVETSDEFKVEDSEFEGFNVNEFKINDDSEFDGFKVDENSEFDINFGSFEVSHEIITEESKALPAFDSAFDLDFTTFDLEEEAVIEEPKSSPVFDSAFDLDFTTFDLEKEAVIEEPKNSPVFDSAFDLDFTTFDLKKETVIKESKTSPVFDSGFDLDFSLFETEKETVVEESKIEPSFDLDFGDFAIEKDVSLKKEADSTRI